MPNIAQLCTIDQARAFAMACNAKGVGGGVQSEDASNNYVNDNSGIYLAIWVDAGNQPVPEIGEARQYLLRFNATNTGFVPQGFNIGLSLDVALRHGSLGYALESLDNEVKLAIKNAEGGN